MRTAYPSRVLRRCRRLNAAKSWTNGEHWPDFRPLTCRPCGYPRQSPTGLMVFIETRGRLRRAEGLGDCPTSAGSPRRRYHETKAPQTSLEGGCVRRKPRSSDQTCPESKDLWTISAPSRANSRVQIETKSTSPGDLEAKTRRISPILHPGL